MQHRLHLEMCVRANLRVNGMGQGSYVTYVVLVWTDGEL